MRLRSSLLLLSLATAAPLLALSVLAGVYVFEREYDNLVSATIARNRATLEAVDSELQDAIDALRALSSSPSLARDDLASLHKEASLVLGMQPHWRNIVVSRPDGRQVVNPRLPWGAPLPADDADPRSLQAAVSTRAPVISDLSFAPVLDKRPGIEVRIPVETNGQVAWVLTAVVKPEVFQQLLTNQKLPDGWIGALVGRDGRIVARVPSVPPGTYASGDYRSHIAVASEGWYRGATIEGRDTYTAFSRSQMTGWSLAYAIPAEAIIGSAFAAGTMIAAGILLSVASALLIGYWLSRRIAKPISELVGAAKSLGDDLPAAEVDSTIDEVTLLSHAVSEASATIRQRDDELRRINEQLRVHAAELTKANANKTRFLALLSHELRNPLAPLRNGLAILQSSNDPRLHTDTRAMMERQLKHLTRLIEDLLDVGRIDRGQIPMHREPVLLESAVQAAIESTKAGMETKRQELVVRYSPVPRHVLGDPVRLTQVFINLLGNASKYTPRGGRIEVRMSEDGEQAVVSVSDSGVGFSAADGGRIFDMFVRLERRPGEEDPGGLGIGLTLTRALVQLHHGRIEAASEGPGHGATFTVTLPTCTPSTAPAEAEAPARHVPAAGGRILIADDNLDAAQTFADLLRLEGFDVREAHDGVEALQSAREFRPHVAFLDLDMPRMTGIQVAMQLRQLAGSARPHMVALTGWGQEADLAAARAAGFDEHLTKPADPAAALRIVAKALERAPIGA
jgi:signal transduction histidine kinase/ActR/RegA family two-component response regulator